MIRCLIFEIDTGTKQYKFQHNSKTIPGYRKHRSVAWTTREATEEKNVHQEDLQFHLELLDELGGFESESEEEVFAEAIERPEPEAPCEHIEITGATEAETPKPKLTRAEIQEAKDKARAWHLDRKREKEKKR